MARSYVGRELVALGGQPVLRRIHDRQRQRDPRLSGLSIVDPAQLEANINNIVGVVTDGLFARRGADVILLGAPDGVRTLSPR